MSALFKELDYQKFLFSELDYLNLKDDTLLKAEEEVDELSNIDELKNKLLFSVDSINSDENGILNRLSDVLNNIKSVEKFSKKLKSYNFRIESIYTDLRDILNDFEGHLMSLNPNPELLKVKNLELENLYSILKKHNVSFKTIGEFGGESIQFTADSKPLIDLSVDKAQKTWLNALKEMVMHA